MPWQYRKKNLEKFDLVIPMSSWRAENMGLSQYAFHPYDFDSSKRISPFIKRDRKCVMINSAKFSSGTRSLYGLRRRTSKLLHQKSIDYCLYGSNWQMSRLIEIRKRFASLKNSVLAMEKVNFRELTSELFYSYPEYGGWVEDKFRILSQFQISMVIENEKDWVTEKLFDSLVAGAVPLYIGPDLTKKFPKLNECILLADSTPRSIYERIVNVSDQELEDKQQAIDSYLNITSQEGINFWSPSNQWKRIANIVTENLGNL